MKKTILIILSFILIVGFVSAHGEKEDDKHYCPMHSGVNKETNEEMHEIMQISEEKAINSIMHKPDEGWFSRLLGFLGGKK